MITLKSLIDNGFGQIQSSLSKDRDLADGSWVSLHWSPRSHSHQATHKHYNLRYFIPLIKLSIKHCTASYRPQEIRASKSLLPGIKPDVYCFIDGSFWCLSRLFNQLRFNRIHRTDRSSIVLHPRVECEFHGSYLYPDLNGIVSPDHGFWAKHKVCCLGFEYCFKQWWLNKKTEWRSKQDLSASKAFPYSLKD